MGIRIMMPGPLTTVQDLGRKGYQSIGFTTSGVLDYRAAVLANLLVGNDKEEAVLEATLLGPMIEFTQSNIIAVTGGDFEAKLNGVLISPYQAIHAATGDVLSFGMPKCGCRCYIAFAGGLDIPKVMKSKSTNLRCQTGGFHGRKLMAGDELDFIQPVLSMPKLWQRNLETERKKWTTPGMLRTVRVICGMQEDAFTTEGIQTFFSQTYTMTNESDRMGCKLSGPQIKLKNGSDIISDGIVSGAIQIPDSGQPIIMLSDRQTTGGYAKLGAVCFVDLPKVVQAKAGDQLKFEPVTVKKAQKLYRREQKEYQKLQKEGILAW